MAVILVVDDDASVLENVCAALKRAGHEVVAASTGEEAIRMAPLVRPALLLLDLKLQHPDLDGLAVFRRIRADLPDAIGVIMTGYGTLPQALESGRAGIAEYIAKPFRPEELVTIIDGVLAMHRRPPALPRWGIEVAGAEAFDGMIGTSTPMRNLFRWIVRAAPLDTSVLICGGTGTGKELVARSIHRRSSRAGGPFVTVNCAAVPTTLFEAQFFGHERGAFTDAKEAKPGFFEQAHGGTLLLDEVGELALEAQAKLLRVLAQREVLRLGGRHPTPVDVRIVAATNVDMALAVREGRFREDLYWRLNDLTLRVPSVRERAGDVTLLIDWFFARIRAELRRPSVALAPEARQALVSHDWPGNVREMEHVIRAAVLTASSETVGPDDLTLEPSGDEPGSGREHFDLPEGTTLRKGLADIDERLEREWIQQALAAARGNQAEAARRLGINARTLYSKMRRHGLRER